MPAHSGESIAVARGAWTTTPAGCVNRRRHFDHQRAEHYFDALHEPRDRELLSCVSRLSITRHAHLRARVHGVGNRQLSTALDPGDALPAARPRCLGNDAEPLSRNYRGHKRTQAAPETPTRFHEQFD